MKLNEDCLETMKLGQMQCEMILRFIQRVLREDTEDKLQLEESLSMSIVLLKEIRRYSR